MIILVIIIQIQRLSNNQSSSNSIFLLGYFNFHGIETSINKEKAFNLFINASEKDHILAQYYAGECYLFGLGTKQNEKLAFECYEKIKNYAMGQKNIGYCYYNGIGVKKDLKMAFYWYEKAANNGNMIAMYNLGLFYENGFSVEKDIDNAIYWYEKSAKQGSQNAQSQLEILTSKIF